MKLNSLKWMLCCFLALFGAVSAHAMRWYSSSTGRWVSRDPIKERGGINLYGMVENNPISRVDVLGKLPYFHGEYDFTTIDRFYRELDRIGESSPIGKALRCWIKSRKTRVNVTFGRFVRTAGGSGQDDEDENGNPTPHPDEGDIVLNTGNDIWLNPTSDVVSAFPSELPTSGAVTIAHEAGHAGPGQRDPGVVATVENAVRLGLGDPTRDSYHGGPITPTAKDLIRLYDFLKKSALKKWI